MSERGKTEVEIQVLTEGVEPAPRTDRLAVEEPLEVRLGDEPVAVLMPWACSSAREFSRTPTKSCP